MRILIVDDNEKIRRGIRSLLLAYRKDWSICGEAKDGLEATEMARELRPDIVLMDLRMPGMGGVEATRVIRRDLPNTRVIIVSDHEIDPMRLQVGELEASAYIAKIDMAWNLVSTIEKVADPGRTLAANFDSTSPIKGRGNGQSVHMTKNTRGANPNYHLASVDGISAGESQPWSDLLADAVPRDHIVQLYQDQQFLNQAVCRFAAAAIANGEGVILVPTIAHWDAFRPRLESEGVDVKAAESRGQLTIVDADDLLPTFMHDGMPDSPVFLGLAANVIAQARGAGRYPKVRWWGEMVNLLWERGDVAASMNLEDLFDHLAHEQDVAIFCSFLMDNFDGDVHARMLPRLGENHSHLIPVEDYARLEWAVSEALRETVGPDESRVLENQLLSRYPGPFHMPRSQALLLALRQALPLVADDVLRRSRSLYQAAD